MQFVRKWAGPIWMAVCLQILAGSIVIAAVTFGRM